MEQKPSERIIELLQENLKNLGKNDDPITIQQAIIKYLDEQWEKNKTPQQRQMEAEYPRKEGRY